jgi:hypothetical protein
MLWQNLTTNFTKLEIQYSQSFAYKIFCDHSKLNIMVFRFDPNVNRCCTLCTLQAFIIRVMTLSYILQRVSDKTFGSDLKKLA